MAETEFRHPTLAAALAAFQAELPSIRKGNTADTGSYKYSYADLSDVSEAALPLLGSHGVAWSAQPTLMDGDFVLHYSLTHEGGEAIEGIYPLPARNTPPQAMGSAITYARRYAFTAITGLAPGGDDDDAAGAPAAPAQTPARTQSPAARRKAQPTMKPTEQPASKDYAALLIDVDSVASLKDAWGIAEDAGDLGRPFDPQFKSHMDALVHLFGVPAPTPEVTVGQMITVLKPLVEERASQAVAAGMLNDTPDPDDGEESMALGDPVDEWPTATPGGEQS